MNFPETPSFSLKNKRALVTGAGRGIGLGASIALASAGADVMMVSRTAKELEEIYNHLKSNNMSAVFKNYVEGTNILNKLLFKKRLSNKNKKLLEYGKKILNLTYLEIAKFI